jgi:hypothetical protein
MWVDFEAEAPKPKEAQQVFAYFKRKAKARFYADENFPDEPSGRIEQTLRRGSTRVRAQERPSGGDL